MRKSIGFFILCVLVHVDACGTINGNGRSAPDNGPKSLDIPLYEYCRPWSNYAVSQPIEQALRWGSMGVVAGGLVGLAIGAAGSDGCGLRLAIGTAVGVLSGGGTGLLAGGVYGIGKGIHLNREKASSPRLHVRRERIGYMYTMLARSIAAHDSPYVIGRYHEAHDPGLFLVYRRFNDKLFVPDFYSAGYFEDFWGTYDTYEECSGSTCYSDLDVILRRIELNACFRIADWRFFEPMIGIGGGYAWGAEHAQEAGPHGTTHHTPFVHLTVACQASFFDFFFSHLEANYEFLGMYQQLQADYPYAGNFYLRWSLGTYIL